MATARAVLYAFFNPTENKVMKRTLYMLRFCFPPRAVHARFDCSQSEKTMGIKHRNSESVLDSVHLSFNPRILRILFSIVSNPSRISKDVEVLNIIDAHWIAHRSFISINAASSFMRLFSASEAKKLAAPVAHAIKYDSMPKKERSSA